MRYSSMNLDIELLNDGGIYIDTKSVSFLLDAFKYSIEMIGFVDKLGIFTAKS